MSKNSLILYHDYAEPFSTLTDEELGNLIRTVLEYEMGNLKKPKYEGKMLAVWLFIKNNLDRDRVKYDRRCETSKLNGKKGGRPKKDGTKKTYKKPNNLKKADIDNDIDTDTVTDIENDTENDIDIPPTPKGVLDICALKKPPSLDEITAYAETRNRTDLAQAFYDFFTTGNWYDSQGNPVKNWKQKFITWEKHNFKNKETKHNEKNNNPQEGQQNNPYGGYETILE